MDDFIIREKAIEAANYLKDAPEWMQNYNLLKMCKTDPTGDIEKIARILAAHGIKSEEVIPCIMELMLVFLKKEKY